MNHITDVGQPLSLLGEVSSLIFSISSLPGDGVTLLGIETSRSCWKDES